MWLFSPSEFPSEQKPKAPWPVPGNQPGAGHLGIKHRTHAGVWGLGGGTLIAPLLLLWKDVRENVHGPPPSSRDARGKDVG